MKQALNFPWLLKARISHYLAHILNAALDNVDEVSVGECHWLLS